MQGSLFGILFIGLLADLPAILDSHHKCFHKGGGEPQSGGEKHTSPPCGPIGAVHSPKSRQSVDNNTN